MRAAGEALGVGAVCGRRRALPTCGSAETEALRCLAPRVAVLLERYPRREENGSPGPRGGGTPAGRLRDPLFWLPREGSGQGDSPVAQGDLWG